MRRIACLLAVLLPAPLGNCPALSQEQPIVAKLPELRAELLRRFKVDQDARKRMIEWMASHGEKGLVVTEKLSDDRKSEFASITGAVKTIDEENTQWLSTVVKDHGWPTISLVGKDGANAAWLLVQHADANLDFQRRCLDLMASAPKEEVSQSNLAYLTDRVLLAEGKKQVFGTQFTLIDGKLKPRPMEDEANVDKRRKEVGLMPLAEYARIIQQQYGGKP